MFGFTSIRDRINRYRATHVLYEVHLSDMATGQPLPFTVRKLSDWHCWEVVSAPCPALYGFDELPGMRDYLKTINGTVIAPNGVVVTLVGHPCFA
jgi:hypothetical protein